jgi:hypothetical protein
MTPEERARLTVLKWYQGPYPLHVEESDLQIEITSIAAAIRDAINDKLDEVAVAMEAEGRFIWHTHAAGLVRAMKVK